MLKKLLTLILTTLVLTSNSATLTLAQAETASATESSPIDPEVIKENVRRRIQEVIRGDTDENLPKAYAGSLTSMTDLTLTISTLSGTQLASVSAFTQFLTLPQKNVVTLSDLSIDSYIVALGYLNESEVIDARQVFIHSSRPATPTSQAFFGHLDNYDQTESTLTLTNPATGAAVTLDLSAQTLFQKINPGGIIVPAKTSDLLHSPQSLLATYTTDSQTGISRATQVLLKFPPDSHIFYEEASTSADVLPPELRP